MLHHTSKYLADGRIDQTIPYLLRRATEVREALKKSNLARSCFISLEFNRGVEVAVFYWHIG